MGMPKTAKKLHKETNQDLIDDEVEAIEGYDKAIEESDNPEAIATYEHIKGEEEEHIAELEGLDKMKMDEITSEQAWEDFKAGYSDFEEKHIGKGREGDKASLEEKIDVLSAKISELNTDMSRLTDSVPQALGTIEEGKTLEDEAEEEQEEGMLEGEEVAGEEGGLFDDGEDDGLGEFFTDEEGGEEAPADEEGNPTEDGGEDGEEVLGEEDGESIDEGEEVVEDDADDTSEEGADKEITDEEEGDFIPIDDVMGDDEEEVSEEETETEEEPVEEEKEKEDEEEVIDKMVRILEKMDKRISHLERENAGLKKQLSERMTVQTEPNSMAKSRPKPNTNLKLVKGSYNRPPVSTQYVANQRDIGIGKKAESSNTSVFRQGLNEVFENCERIANQNHF